MAAIKGEVLEVEKIGPGKPIEETVSGSLDHVMQVVSRSFDQEFNPRSENEDEYIPRDYWISEMFRDFIIVVGPDLGPGQYYQATYSIEGNEASFQEQAEWTVVELTFEPASTTAPAEESSAGQEAGLVDRMASREQSGDPAGVGNIDDLEEPVEVGESAAPNRGDGQKFRESLDAQIQIEEAIEGEPRIIRAVVAQAGVINGNGRRYRKEVLQEAVADARHHLQESLSQGRAILLGEAEHPSDKKQKPQFLETIVVWKEVDLDESGTLTVAGEMIENSRGKDAIITMDAGVFPGISLRGRGEVKVLREGKNRVAEVQWVRFTGFDLVLAPSFENAAVTVLESNQTVEENTMDPEVTPIEESVDEEALRNQIREELEQEAAEAAAAAERQHIASIESNLRESLGLDADADLDAALVGQSARLAELEEAANQAAVTAYVEEQIAGVDYPDNVQERLQTLVGNPATVEEAQGAFENARSLVDAFLADMRLEQRGMRGNVEVLGPVIERETGQPEFAAPALAIAESLARSSGHMGRNLAEPRNVNERFTAEYLRRYDAEYQHHLIREAREWAEAETTVQLNLPYAVTRAVIEEAFPELIAASLFDVRPVNAAPIRLWYEVVFEAEAGATSTVTDESITSSHDAWVDLANAHLDWGSVVVTSDPAGTTYDEGDDYVIDYIEGRIKVLSIGSMADATNFLADYTSKNYRQGEGVGIERTRTTLSYQTLDQKADRLATQITAEAIVFSRSQLGYDVVNGNIAAMVRDLMRTIDGNLFGNALSEVLAMANNSGGTWDSSSDALSLLEQYIGTAKVKVANRYSQPTGIIMSLTNSDLLSNLDRFSAASSRPDASLDPAGYVGRLKGLPVFASTEFPDAYILVCNRQLVMHRIFQPLQLKGPIQVFDSNRKVVASEEYYGEEFNGTAVPVPGKGATVKIV